MVSLGKKTGVIVILSKLQSVTFVRNIIASQLCIKNLNPLGLAWWYIDLGPRSVVLLEVSCLILSGTNLDGLI